MGREALREVTNSYSVVNGSPGLFLLCLLATFSRVPDSFWKLAIKNKTSATIGPQYRECFNLRSLLFLKIDLLHDAACAVECTMAGGSFRPPFLSLLHGKPHEDTQKWTLASLPSKSSHGISYKHIGGWRANIYHFCSISQFSQVSKPPLPTRENIFSFFHSQ